MFNKRYNYVFKRKYYLYTISWSRETRLEYTFKNHCKLLKRLVIFGTINEDTEIVISEYLLAIIPLSDTYYSIPQFPENKTNHRVYRNITIYFKANKVFLSYRTNNSVF